MARGALLGAVACLCFLAPAAEAFKRRGPSVTAKVTLACGRGGVSAAGKAREGSGGARGGDVRGRGGAAGGSRPAPARPAPGTEGLGRAWPSARTSRFYWGFLVGWLLGF